MIIFMLPVLAISAATALFTVTTGMNFAIVAMATLEVQRRKGYKGGEGMLSQREAKRVYSTRFDANSEHDLSMDLGRLAHVLPNEFKEYVGKKYDITKSEGHMLRSILRPVMVALDQVEGIKEALKEDLHNEDLQQLYAAAMGNVGMLLQPVVIFLQQFPSKRVKKVS